MEAQAHRRPSGFGPRGPGQAGRFPPGAVALALSAILATSAAPARADDWSLSRPRGGAGEARPKAKPGTSVSEPERASGDRRDTLIARHLKLLLADPGQRFSLDRLLALYRERDGRLDGLVSELEALRARDGDGYALLLLIGHVARARQDSAAAGVAYRRAAELAPDQAAPLRALSELARESGDMAATAELLSKALSLAKVRDERTELMRALAELELDRGEFDAAAKRYAELARSVPDSVFQATEFARALAARQHHERAIAAYRAAIDGLRGDNRVLPPVLLELARAQLSQGDTEGALETLERARKLAGPSAGVRYEIDEVMVEAFRRAGRLPELAERLAAEKAGRFESLELLGRVCEEIADHDRALDAYRRALRLRPRDVDTRLRLVRLLSRQGDLAQAIVEYQRLVAIVPDEPRFVVELAQMMLESGKRQEALALLARTGARHPREARLHRALFELYSRWDEHALARRELELLARIEPNDPSHLMALGEQQLERGNRAEALATWRKILKSGGDRARAHASLATTYLDHDMPERALAEFQAAVQLEPKELEYLRGLAETLERLRRHRDAAEQWQKVLELASADRTLRREARRRIVRLWTQTGDVHKKVREFEELFAFGKEGEDLLQQGQKRDVEAGRFLAECYQALGNQRRRRSDPRYLRAAERVLGKVIELEPGDVESMLALERLRSLGGNTEGAIAVLEQLVEADPKNARSYLARMAQHALSLYRDDEAVAYAERLVALNPDDASAHQRLGDLYRARQQVDRAMASYRRAVELNEQAYAVYFVLAEMHLSRGELEQADRLLRQVMRSSPDDELVKRAARALIQQHLGSPRIAALEQELLPLSLGHPQRPVYRRLLVELYDVMSRSLIQRTRGESKAAAEAREELSTIGRRAVKPLLEALSDDDPGQRRIAIDILGYLQNDHAALPLLAVAEAEGETLLRRQALLAAGAVAPDALAGRIAALARAPERRLWDAAAWALSRMDGPAAQRELRELARHSMAEVRAYALLGLGQQRDKTALAAMHEALRRDRMPLVRAAAALAIGLCGERAALSSLTGLLRSSANELSGAAAVGLGVLGDAGAAPALAEAVFSPASELQRAALWALRQLGGSGRDRVRLRLAEPLERAEVRLLLARWLEIEPPARSLPLVTEYREELAAAAQAALRGSPESVESALALLAGDGAALAPEGDTGAVHALSRSLVPELVPLLDHPKAAVREAAVRLLAVLPEPDAVAAVVRALSDAEQPVRVAALEALAPRHATAGFAAAAAIAAEDGDWWMRVKAVEALARIEDPRAGSVLGGVLQRDPYAYVREAAARGLARVGSEAEVPALAAAAARDAERRVRAIAVGSLQAMGGEAARRALQRLRPSQRRDVSLD